jgi:hypothetical protein
MGILLSNDGRNQRADHKHLMIWARLLFITEKLLTSILKRFSYVTALLHGILTAHVYVTCSMNCMITLKNLK